MVEAVDPSFGASGKVTVLGTNVVGLAEVIPGADLDEGNLVAVSDKSLPAGDPEVLITIEHELSGETLALAPVDRCPMPTHVLVEGVSAEVGEEPGGGSGHVRLGAALDAGQAANELVIGVERPDELLKLSLALSAERGRGEVRIGDRLSRVSCRDGKGPSRVELRDETSINQWSPTGVDGGVLTLNAPSMTPPKVLKVAGSMKKAGTKWTLPVVSGCWVNCVFQPVGTSAAPNVHDSPANVETNALPSTVSCGERLANWVVKSRMAAPLSAVVHGKELRTSCFRRSITETDALRFSRVPASTPTSCQMRKRA